MAPGIVANTNCRDTTRQGYTNHKANGYEIENKTIPCSICKDKTAHRRLVSTTPTNASFVRSALPESLKGRVKEVYKNNVEAITQRTYQPAELEVDHRFAQLRWSKPEDANPPDMSDDEIVAKFQLLTRQHNLWKSRYCERCKEFFMSLRRRSETI